MTERKSTFRSIYKYDRKEIIFHSINLSIYEEFMHGHESQKSFKPTDRDVIFVVTFTVMCDCFISLTIWGTCYNRFNMILLNELQFFSYFRAYTN